MQFMDLIRDWIDTEYKGELKVQSLSNSDEVGQITKPFINERIEFVIAYITEQEVVFGPNWGDAIWVQASDPELFNKMRTHIAASGYAQHSCYKPGTGNFQTMM